MVLSMIKIAISIAIMTFLLNTKYIRTAHTLSRNCSYLLFSDLFFIAEFIFFRQLNNTLLFCFLPISLYYIALRISI